MRRPTCLEVLMRGVGCTLCASLLIVGLSGCFDYEASYWIDADGQITVEGIIVYNPLFYQAFREYADDSEEEGLSFEFVDDIHSMRFRGVSEIRAVVTEDGRTTTYLVPTLLDREFEREEVESDVYTTMLFAGHRCRVQLHMPGRVLRASHGRIERQRVVVDMDLASALKLREITVEVASGAAEVSPILILVFVLVGIGLIIALSVIVIMMLRERR